jgi:hypothetical protein
MIPYGPQREKLIITESELLGWIVACLFTCGVAFPFFVIRVLYVAYKKAL